MSGSIRSSTTRAGWSDATWRSASPPVPAVRTAYPAFFRYAATKDAIDGSSSTTRTDCVFCAIVSAADREPRPDVGERPEVGAVDRVAAVDRKRRGALEPDLSGGRLADGVQVDAYSVEADRVFAAVDAEAHVLALPDLLARIGGVDMSSRVRHHRDIRVARRQVVDHDPAAVDLPEDGTVEGDEPDHRRREVAARSV